MSGILKALGIAVLARTILAKATASLTDKIAYGFKSISLADISLFKASIKLKLVVTNKMRVPIMIESFQGFVISGELRQVINMSQSLTLDQDKTVIANFTISVDNGLLLEQIANQIESKEVPKLRVKGTLKGGIEGKTVQFPIDQIINIV